MKHITLKPIILLGLVSLIGSSYADKQDKFITKTYLVRTNNLTDKPLINGVDSSSLDIGMNSEMFGSKCTGSTKGSISDIFNNESRSYSIKAPITRWNIKAKNFNIKLSWKNTKKCIAELNKYREPFSFTNYVSFTYNIVKTKYTTESIIDLEFNQKSDK